MAMMKAAVKVDDQKRLVMQELPIPKPGPGQALLKIKTTGLCGSDVAIRKGTFVGRHGPVKLPIVPGHEFCGEVVEVGPGVTKVKVGDRVTTSCLYGCGECYACKVNILNRCRNWVHYGIDVQGSFAEYMVVEQDICFHVPEFITDEQAAILEPITTAVRAIRTNNITPGSFIVLFGPGPFGLFILQALATTSPRRLVVVGLSSDKERLELAKKLGATDVIMGDVVDPVEAILEMTNGWGAEVVAEATGDVNAVTQALEICSPGGLVLMGGSGFAGKSVVFQPWNVVRDEKRLKGLQGFEWADYLLMLELVKAGKIQIDPLISSVQPLETVNEACDLVEEKKVYKIVLKP